MSMQSNGATRNDHDTQIREEAEFFGSKRLRMFGCTHLPLRSPTAGLVVCCSIQAEFVKNYRKEVLLARSLSPAGVAVQRFHYRGTGNSDGDTADATFKTMRDDALEAAETLKRKTGVSKVAFAGTRWGGLIASAAAARFDGAPLILWEPALDPARYFREVFRSRLIHNLKDGETPPPFSQLLDELKQKGSLDILGHAIDYPLYASAIGHTLADEIGTSPRPVLLIQLSRGQNLREDYRSIISSWEDLGFLVQSRVIGKQEAWWFAGERWDTEDTRPSTRELIDATSQWTMRHLSLSGAKR